MSRNLPLPKETNQLWDQLHKNCENPGLHFTRYFDRWNEDFSEIAKKEKKLFLDEICKSAQSSLLKKVIDGLHERQDTTARELAKAGWTVLRIQTQQNSPLTSRLGEEHPLENGFMFHPLYGVPYLPASSVKGAVRSALLWGFLAECGKALDSYLSADEKGSMSALFGSPDKNLHAEMQRGELIFFDAFPDSSVLKVDVANPHFPDYYRGKKGPTDDQNPNPIFFLTVPENTAWTFYVLGRKWQQGLDQGGQPKPNSAYELADENSSLRKAINAALHELGLGAKKSAGYGTFSVTSAEILQADSSAPATVSKNEPIDGHYEDLLLQVDRLTEKDKGNIDGLLDKANKRGSEAVLRILNKLKEKVTPWRDRKLNQKIDSWLTKLKGDGA